MTNCYDGNNSGENELTGLEAVSNYLNIDVYSASDLLKAIDLTPVRQIGDVLTQQPVYKISEMNEALENYSSENGLDEKESALELGLTIESFRAIKDKIKYGKNNKYLKVFIQEFRDRYLPQMKTWSRRSSLLKEFVQNYNAEAQLKELPNIENQMCEIDSCVCVASDQCINEECRSTEGMEPRFVCPAHEVWANTHKDARKKPDVICSECDKLGDKLEIERF